MKLETELTKQDAISLVAHGHTSSSLSGQHFLFANINRRKNVWWLDVPEALLAGPAIKLGFLLFDRHSANLHHLIVPASFLRVNRNRFSRKLRNNGTPVIPLELSANEDQLFTDIRPGADRVRFKSFRHCSLPVKAKIILAGEKTSGAYQKQRRNQRKEDLIKVKGGGCKKCGYKKSASALVFHHRDEKYKMFNISGQNLNKYSWEKLLEEANKCDLLCANCHAETHDREGWIHENGKKTVKTARVI